MDGLVNFHHPEQVQSVTTTPVIIADGGGSHDFPILLANCMKYDYDFHLTALAECMFVDSMRVLQNRGYKRPGLNALCNDLNMKRSGHSAFEDADILMTICKRKSEIFSQQYGFTFCRTYCITWIRNCRYQYRWCTIWPLIVHRIKS